MELITLEDNLSSCNKCRNKRNSGDGNSNNNINITIDNYGNTSSRKPELPSRLSEYEKPVRTNNSETDKKIDALLREIQDIKNRPEQPSKIEKQTIFRHVPIFLDKIKKVFVQVPYNREVERVRDRVEQVPYNQEIERVRDRVEQAPYNREVERVRDRVEQAPYNQEIERVRDRVEQVPHNTIIDRIKKRYVIVRENQPPPPRGL